MLGSKERDQLELFITGSLRQLVPDDHVLARVDRVLDLSWLRSEVANLYCEGNGRPGIDPEVAVRLMLAGFLLGIVHDRRLMREAQVNVAIRWFVGYGLHEMLPDHSSLTRIRQRWGAERFRWIFQRSVKACVEAKIAKGEVVHVDASLIRANVSWESLAVRHADAVAEANEDDADVAERTSRQTGRHKKVCTTDPEASMATNGRNRRLEPSYKQHAVVDDVRGVVLDVEVTTGEINEGQVILERIDAAAATTGAPISTVTADAGYAYAKVYGGLERRGVNAVIPTKAEPIRSAVPTRRFAYDAKNDLLKCPRGKISGQRDRSAMAASSMPDPEIAGAAIWLRSACRRAAGTKRSSSGTTIPRSYERAAAANVGARRSKISTDGTVGDRRATMARPRHGTVLPEPCDVAWII